MAKAIRTRFRVTVWVLNYPGMPGSVEDDIKNLVAEAIKDFVTTWIAGTGNVGFANVGVTA